MNVGNSAAGEGTTFPAGHPSSCSRGGTLQLPVAKAVIELVVMGKLHDTKDVMY